MEIMVFTLRQPRGLWTLISPGRLSTSGSAGWVLDANSLDAKDVLEKWYENTRREEMPNFQQLRDSDEGITYTQGTRHRGQIS